MKYMVYNCGMNWIIYAILSAFFASLVAIFGKIGIKDVDSNLAVAIRTVIIVFFVWGIVFLQGNVSEIFKISKFSYVFIILSAIATGLSWLFYYKALQIGPVSSVAPIDKLSIVMTVVLAFIFLGEKMTLGNVFGAIIVTIGVLVTILIK
jgi:transporter family protein